MRCPRHLDLGFLKAWVLFGGHYLVSEWLEFELQTDEWFFLASKEQEDWSPFGAAQKPNPSQTVSKDWGKYGKKANAKFQLAPSEISAQSYGTNQRKRNDH